MSPKEMAAYLGSDLNRALIMFKELEDQSELFGMDIDIEKWDLKPKNNTNQTWRDNHLNRDSDRMPSDYQGWE